MAKAKKKKAPAIARTEVTIEGNEHAFLTQESYMTLKNRLLDSREFIELTQKIGRKVLFNKRIIKLVMPIM